MIAKRITYVIVVIVGVANIIYDVFRDVDLHGIWWFMTLNSLLIIIGIYLFIMTFKDQ